jgi:uncharacterized protein YbcI
MLIWRFRFAGFSIFLRPARGRLRGRRKAVPMTGTQEPSDGNRLQAVSNTMVKLHKEQFGRGPTNARSYFAGPDALVCTLEDALLPAERTMVEMGEHQRVRESRMFLQVATQDQFIAAVEALVSRKVRAFASAIDPGPGVVFEIFSFDPDDAHGDATTPA